MTEAVFRKGYADHYDELYGDKDYAAECDLIEQTFQRFARKPVRRILDLGCGTGSHAIPLAHRGYMVTGVDRSAEMLLCAEGKAARERFPEGCEPPAFVQADVRSLALGEQFDAVLMMFAVLGYQLTNDDVLAALRSVKEHLAPGGLFICDVWYGPAVLSVRPSERVKVIPTADGQIIRAASGSLDTFRHLCEVRYHLWTMSRDRLLSETEESHQMRYFFPQELRTLMHFSEIRLLDISSFEDPTQPPSEATWSVVVTAEQVHS
jgi:SAM-dependent methyltransferase